MSELLSLVIGSGAAARPVHRLADDLLGFARGSLRYLASATPAELECLAGVDGATSAKLLAELELARRLAHERRPERVQIRGPADVFDLMLARLVDRPHEESHCLLMNTQHRVLRDLLVTRGILDASLIHPREVFQPAILERAASVILVQNHPSGDPTPSAEDRAVSRQMSAAGRSIGIVVLDHVVVADDGWPSAMSNGE